jgi:hypothetical protein
LLNYSLQEMEMLLLYQEDGEKPEVILATEDPIWNKT